MPRHRSHSVEFKRQVVQEFLGGNPLRATILDLRRAGYKTEPAFAFALGLSGDPYNAMLQLADRSDAALLQLLAMRGHRLKESCR